MRKNQTAIEPMGVAVEEESSSTPPPIALVVLAVELGEPVELLVARLGGEVTLDEVTGLRVVGADVCRRLIGEAHARAAWLVAHQREAEAKIRAMNTPPPGPVDKHTEELAFHGSKLGGLR